jgi:hypothetical protein
MKKNDIAIIKAALDRSLIRETARISEYIDTLQSPSDEFFARLDKAAEDIIERRKKTISFKKIISAIAVAALLVSITAFSVAASRGKLKGFFVEFFDDFAKLTPEDDLSENKDVAITDVSIGYIPEGFEESGVNVNYRSAYYEWALDDKCIALLYNVHANGSAFLNTDDSSATEVIIGDKSVWRTERFGQISTTWTDGKIVYSLACTGVEWEEIVKIIEGISYIEE